MDKSTEWFEVIRFQHTATRRWLRQRLSLKRLMVLFQHTATRRWLPVACGALWVFYEVSTHSHPKVAAATWIKFINFDKVSTHSHPKVAAQELNKLNENLAVSTHSHPKVAALFVKLRNTLSSSFNTQPPEGGCQIH